jgi:hypothetical protein
LSAVSEAFNLFRRAFVPVLLNNVDYIPIPKIEGSTDKYTYALDHVWFSLKDILPDRIHFSFDTDTDFSVRELTPDVFRLRFGILIRDVEVHLRDVWFYFRKFTGIRWEDHGIMDLDLDGMAINWDYSVVHTNEGRWEFALRDANCTIRRVGMRFKRAKHRTLDGLVASLFAGTIKKRVQAMVREQLWGKGDLLSRRLNYWFNERPLIMRERKLERARLDRESGRRGFLNRPVKKVTKRRFRKYSSEDRVDKKMLPERRGFFGQKKETYPADDIAPERVGAFGNIKETYPSERPSTTYVEEKEYVGYEPRKGSLRKGTTKEDYYEKKEIEEPLDRKHRHEATGRNVETSA